MAYEKCRKIHANLGRSEDHGLTDLPGSLLPCARGANIPTGMPDGLGGIPAGDCERCRQFNCFHDVIVPCNVKLSIIVTQASLNVPIVFSDKVKKSSREYDISSLT
ncbi:MAG: hypothetical protein MUP71_01195 [Candidatus Aminicenantes bacterium]|nr:hypothetical protein [Candidatus Aminicenantes bacterium]